MTVLIVGIKPIGMWQHVKTSETEESDSLVRWGTAERKQPVQTIYRGLMNVSLGKCRNLAREQPGNPRRELWKPALYP